jgi:hypothetical protein
MATLTEVIENCKEYIEILRASEKGCFLIRGVKEDDFDIELLEHCVEYRKPRDTHIKVHNAINEHFEKQFGWRVRNGLFTYGAKNGVQSISTHYGTTYLVFPCGNFKYVYDPDIYDLFGSFTEFQTDSSDILKAFLESIYYTDSGLSKGMAAIITDKKSAEILINCQKYYLININYTEELIALIWN